MEKKRILIIDDEADFSKITKLNLELRDPTYSVEIAVDGNEGLKKVKTFRPHLILLDIRMPKIDGMQVLRRLKDDLNTATIPVIMLSAQSDEETKAKTAELFHEDYITKPIEAKELKAKIDEVLKRARIL